MKCYPTLEKSAGAQGSTYQFQMTLYGDKCTNGATGAQTDTQVPAPPEKGG